MTADWDMFAAFGLRFKNAESKGPPWLPDINSTPTSAARPRQGREVLLHFHAGIANDSAVFWRLWHLLEFQAFADIIVAAGNIAANAVAEHVVAVGVSRTRALQSFASVVVAAAAAAIVLNQHAEWRCQFQRRRSERA
jgi:hypothetical protein